MAADSKFEFTLLPSDVLGEIRKKSIKTTELLEKWGLENTMRCAIFTYNNHFQTYQKESFVLELCQSPVVNTTLQAVSSSGQWSALSMASDVTAVSIEEVPATLLTMNFFDRLYSCGVVRESGRIVKCFDEMCGDFLVSDEIKKLLIMEDSDNYDEYSEEERAQFLFRILKHLVLGGPVNQYEDDIQPYLDTAKLLYKELVTVAKDLNTKELSVVSTVYKVQAKMAEVVVFPQKAEHEQSFCYLIIDNIKRHVTVWYNVWY